MLGTTNFKQIFFFLIQILLLFFKYFPKVKKQEFLQYSSVCFRTEIFFEISDAGFWLTMLDLQEFWLSPIGKKV